MSVDRALSAGRPLSSALRDGEAPPACFHCGQPVFERGRWSTPVDGAAREMCCGGCQAVAQAIVAGGLVDYYRHRTGPAAGAALVPPELTQLALFDEPEVQARFVRHAGPACEATLMIDGMRCGACVWLIERSLTGVPGIEAATVNFATERAVVRWDPQATRLSEVLARIGAIGYRVMPFDSRQREANLLRTTRYLFRRLFVAGLAMMQVMMYAFPVYTAAAGDMDWEWENLMRWASFALTVPAVFYSASPFFAGAWRDLKSRHLGMDVPVVIGITAAFVASAWATVTGRGEVYFDSVTMFVFLLLGARYLEWIARRRAARAVDAITAQLPESATRLRGEVAETVPVFRLEPGDEIRVGTGERLPVDAVFLDGRTEIDQALLTGESTPVAKAAGDEAPGGAINVGNPVRMRVLRTGADSTLSMIERLIERAAADKPAIEQIADRVAAWFVLALILFAIGVFAAWSWVDPARALPVSIAVLVVSCPCALSLATPAALAAATGAITRDGVLVARGHALEALATATDVVFDKTGTLTRGEPRLAAVTLGDGVDRRLALAWAAALDSGSPHPFAAALAGACAAEPIAGEAVIATGLTSVPGRGVEGDVGGTTMRLGSRVFVAEWTDPGPEDVGAGSRVRLATRDRVLATFTFEDPPRAEAASTVQQLRALGLRVHLLSGDRGAEVASLAGRLGITDYRGDASPSDKVERIRALQASGGRVLMVGDGINDAPVLAAADVSIAVARASALAKTAADVILLANSIARVPRLLDKSRATRRVIIQNLAWATAYNTIAIPAAALGWIPPWLAAIGMSASSLLVAANALRLGAGLRDGNEVAQAPAATATVR